MAAGDAVDRVGDLARGRERGPGPEQPAAGEGIEQGQGGVAAGGYLLGLVVT
jgi:hypothetical protein